MASYPALSQLMSEHPEVFILRRFSQLHVKSLLYYQAELAELEKELDEVEKEDFTSSEALRKNFGEHWKSLAGKGFSALELDEGAESQDPRLRLQWSLVLRIREVLKEYDEAVLRYTEFCSTARSPRSRSIRRLRQWLQAPEFGHSFISGKPEGVWDLNKDFHDFAVPDCGSEIIDGLTFHLTSLLTYPDSFFKRGKQPYDELHSISGPAKFNFNRATLTTISSMFPVIPIIILFFINQLLVRLGLVLLFTVLFAFAMVFVLGAESDKVLAVTTAFAAIQVVFVGSTNSGLNGTCNTNS